MVREIARLLVAAWLGLRLRAVLLLPIGGLFAYANPESQETANQGAGSSPWRSPDPWPTGSLRSCSPLPSLAPAAMCICSLSPLDLLRHLLRSMVWMQAGLGVLHLLPAYPLDFGRLLRGNFARAHGFAPAGRAAYGHRPVASPSPPCRRHAAAQPWLIIAGFFIMIGAQIEDQGVFFQSVVDTVRMREVMLTDFATLSPSDTLADALLPLRSLPAGRFPRGARTATGRHRLPPAHRRRPAQRRQRLRAIRHVARLPGGAPRGHARHHHPPPHPPASGLSLIPVTESGRVVGIVSVQNLMSSMSLLAEQAPHRSAKTRANSPFLPRDKSR